MTIDNSRESTCSKSNSIFSTYKNRPNNESYHRCFQNYYHSHQYLKPNPVYISSIESTVNHWQLRDLLKFDPSNNQVYYTKNKSINSFNFGPRDQDKSSYVSQEYFDLNYFPRCFNHASDGTVVTGGLLMNTTSYDSQNIPTLASSYPSSGSPQTRRTSKGLFSFYNPHLDTAKTVRLGDMINNDVAIYKDSSSNYSAYVCNNDSYLYCVDVNNNESFKVTNKINCEANMCLNHVTRNPVHDKLLTVTGDCRSIFLVDPKSHSNNSVVKSIRTEHDSGFGTSYHANGYLFATVFQNGSCVLYDLRNIKNDTPLITVKSTRPSRQSGAFRVCKFSPVNDMNDMLIISEHVGRIHVLDLRHLDFNNVDDHQVIVVPYALDQFSDCQKKNYLEDDPESDAEDNPENDDDAQQKHTSVNVYGKNEEQSFPASLVYDYDYVSNSNPKLFKKFVYVPPPKPRKLSYAPAPKFNYPQWNGEDSDDRSDNCNNDSSLSPTEGGAIMAPSFAVNDADMQYAYDNLDEGSPIMSLPERYNYNRSNSVNVPSPEGSYYTNHCDDSYQQAITHVNGEMEISGIEFCSPGGGDSKILVGCQNGGVLVWDVNGDSRRSFGSWGYV